MKTRQQNQRAKILQYLNNHGSMTAMDAIRAVGVYTQTQLIAWDIPKVKARWESHGTGWFLEIVDDSILPGHKTVNLYYGSSTYTVDEMRLLIEWLMDNARQMQIPIPLSKREAEELEKTWGVKV